MSEEPKRERQELHNRARQTTQALEAQAAELLEIAKRIEKLTSEAGMPGWYRGMRTRVEAGATLWQVRILLDTLAELERRTSERST